MYSIDSIFLIDDDNVALVLNETIIRLTGFDLEIQIFPSAERALSRLSVIDSASFPDVIFLDINMPAKNGWDFLDEFEKLPQATIANCKVYMLSSSVDPKDFEKSGTYKSVKGFISKPLKPDKLLSILGMGVVV